MQIISNIKRIFAWLSIIWNDRDFDWGFLAKIMEFKLRRMSVMFDQCGCHIGSKRDAKRMLICAILLKRIANDNYQDSEPYRRLDFRQQEERKAYDEYYLFELMRKHMRSWWD